MQIWREKKELTTLQGAKVGCLFDRAQENKQGSIL